MIGIGFWEFLIVAFIILIIFGSSRLPKLGKGLGEATKNLKKSLKGDEGSQEIEAKEGKVVEEPKKDRSE